MEQLNERIERTRDVINQATYIIVGIGAGFSAAAGFDTYNPENPDDPEEYWSRETMPVMQRRYDTDALPLYTQLLNILTGRNYFIVTTNGEQQFPKAGCPENRYFAAQGDLGKCQCSRGCHKLLYDNRDTLHAMMDAEDANGTIPSDLFPVCPVCGAPMSLNYRTDRNFVEDEAWDNAFRHYEDFTRRIGPRKAVFLEFGVGYSQPGIIRYPFERMTNQNPNAHLIRFNRDFADSVPETADRTITFDEDISQVLDMLYPEEPAPRQFAG